MNAKHDDGGCVFPHGFDTQDHGMTLWDYYAAAALQGYMAATTSQVQSLSVLVTVAAEVADAMLAERRKRGIGQ